MVLSFVCSYKSMVAVSFEAARASVSQRVLRFPAPRVGVQTKAFAGERRAEPEGRPVAAITDRFVSRPETEIGVLVILLGTAMR